MQKRDLVSLIGTLFPQVRASVPFIPQYSRIPTIRKVIAKDLKTIVLFTDGTKSIVSLSSTDTYNLETAILYAVVKRIYGKVDPKTKETKYPNFGKILKKITTEMTTYSEASHKISTPEEFITQEEFEEIFPKKAASKPKSKVAAKLNAMKTSCCKESKYIRPSKPFSEFSQEEKRAYWRFQKAKNRK